MKIALISFLALSSFSLRSENLKTLEVANFKDGEVKMISYKLPDSYSKAPDKLTFKIFNLPFIGIKSSQNDRTYNVLLSSPLGVEKGDYLLTALNDKEKIEEMLVPITNRTNLKTEEVLNTAAEVVLPEKSGTVEKVAQEDVELNSLFKVISPEKLWDKKFVLPIPSRMSMSSPFGIYRVYTKHLRRRTHWGVDYRCPIGTPVKASGDGVVVFAKELYFPGKTIVIDHGLGLYTGYSHLKTMKVKVGDKVKMSKIIGNTGITGKNTGPLIHWFAVNSRVKVDPLTLLKIK